MKNNIWQKLNVHILNVRNQINVKENPLLRPENDKNLEILLSVLKSPQQHNLEIK
jgi:hypothetical protein